MPELPEVETTRRGIGPQIVGREVVRVDVYQRHLRWPISPRLQNELRGQTVDALERRGKYLLLRSATGTLILHLGMTGNLRMVPATWRPGRHDHLDILFDSDRRLRLNDSRRFGAALWTRADPLRHPRLRHLGPEPLAGGFDGDHLVTCAAGRRCAVKSFIMDASVVVGVGNIYANEALFTAGISPGRAAGSISRRRYSLLADAIRKVLQEAIAAGGTTLRDFSVDGRPGFFRTELKVYGREGDPCPRCGNPVHKLKIGQRATFHCGHCQR